MGTVMNYRYLLAFLTTILIPGIANAQNVVALYTPSLDFQDGVARNQFVSQVAKILTDSTGQAWEGKAFARASDFESSLSSTSVAILDADYFTAKSNGLQPVAMLASNGSNKRAMKVIVRKGGSDKLYAYRNQRFSLVSASPYGAAFLTASALDHEIKANDYFSSLTDAHNIRSSINAVAMGNADLTMAFDGYDSGFTTVYTTPAVGLPVIAVNTSKITGKQLESVKSVLQNLPVKTSIITGSTRYDASAASAYQKLAQSKKSASLTYQPAEPENIRFKTSNLSLPAGKTGIPMNPGLVEFAPSLTELDKRLERRL